MNFWSYDYDTTGSRHLHSLTSVFLKQHGIHKEHHLRCFINRSSYNTNFVLSTAFWSAITNKLLLFLFVVHTFCSVGQEAAWVLTRLTCQGCVTHSLLPPTLPPRRLLKVSSVRTPLWSISKTWWPNLRWTRRQWCPSRHQVQLVVAWLHSISHKK